MKHDFADLFGSFSEEEIEVGYLQPGHRCKGRQHWLVDDSDLTDMYKIYEGEKEIMLWVVSVFVSTGSRGLR